MTEILANAKTSTDGMALWFMKINNTIDAIEKQIESKNGFWIFSSHTFSKDEIQTLPEWKTLDGLVGNIDAVVHGWINDNGLTDEISKYYWQNRLAVERKMGEVRARIISRKDTLWETVVNALNYIIRYVMERLPELPLLILERIGFAPTAAQKLLRHRRERMNSEVERDDDL